MQRLILNKNLSPWTNWRHDLPAALVVVLVALPLCLGIALASGAPLFSGLIAGVVGGIVVGLLSRSPLSVSGPAAGLTVIVLAAIQELPSFETFLLAVCLAGGFQIIFGVLRAGVIGDFIPSTVIKGMLAAIGVILILKQLQHAVGYDVNNSGSFQFWDRDGHNTFSSLWYMLEQSLSFGAVIISTISLAFLFAWDKLQARLKGGIVKLLPGPLFVVLFGVLANEAFKAFVPALAIGTEHLVAVPVFTGLQDFLSQFRTPDFTMIDNPLVWKTAFTLAAVASIETLLSIEAIDKLDPFKRATPTNRELFAQGAGNIVSGLIGGLPVTSVIVRSSANVASGGRTKTVTILHGLLLFALVVSIPQWLNYIPLSALAAVLIAVGYKLAKPAIFIERYREGKAYYVPFVATIIAILLTDLLLGVMIGLLIGIAFIVRESARSAVLVVRDGDKILVRFRKDLFFLHKHELRKTLSDLPDNTRVLLDLTRFDYIDLDNAEIIDDFIVNAPTRGIAVTLKQNMDTKFRIKEAPTNVAL